MSNVLETLNEALGGEALKQISNQLGTDEDAAGQAVSAALPVLLEALSRNAADPTGAESLDKALEKDHDFLVKDNVFSETFIETWINYKRKEELDYINLRPHPSEFTLYFNV